MVANNLANLNTTGYSSSQVDRRKVGKLAVAIQEKSFIQPDGRSRVVLRDVAFRLELGEFVAIVGPSGAGKTTLLNIIAGLDQDFTGSVQLGGGPLAAGSQWEGQAVVGEVYQDGPVEPAVVSFAAGFGREQAGVAGGSVQVGGGVHGHVLGAQRVRGAAFGVPERLVEQPSEVTRLAEGDESAEGAFAVAGGGG